MKKDKDYAKEIVLLKELNQILTEENKRLKRENYRLKSANERYAVFIAGGKNV